MPETFARLDPLVEEPAQPLRAKHLAPRSVAWVRREDGGSTRIGRWAVDVNRTESGRWAWSAFAVSDQGSRALGGRGHASLEEAEHDAETVLFDRS